MGYGAVWCGGLLFALLFLRLGDCCCCRWLGACVGVSTAAEAPIERLEQPVALLLFLFFWVGHGILCRNSTAAFLLLSLLRLPGTSKV